MIKYFTLFSLFFVCSMADAQTKSEELHELLSTYNTLNTFNGTALIVHRGEVLINSGFGLKNASEKSKSYSTNIYQIGSITKQFTAAVVLKLSDKKKLHLDDAVSKYIPELKYGDKVSIRHLLTHTSGVFNYTDDGDFMRDKLEKPTTQAEMLQIINAMPLDFEPGTQMKYSNSGYLLLGYIIEAVTQKKYETVVRETIFEPLKMQNSGFDYANLQSPQKATGYESIRDGIGKKMLTVDSTVSFAGGSMYSTTEDLLKWHNALLGNSFIKPGLKQQLFTPHLNNFGMGWVVDRFYDRNAVYHNGSIPGFTSNIYRIEEDNTCIILLNNIANRNIDTITRNLLCLLYDKPFNKPQIKQEIPYTADDVQRYLGEFQFEGNFRMRIFLENQKIYAQRMGEADQFEMFLQKQDTFFLKAFEAELIFSTNSSGVVGGVCLVQSKKTMCSTKK